MTEEQQTSSEKQTPMLPDKLSDLLKVALKDLSICEEDPNYYIDMSQWVEKAHEDGACAVCLAGSVLVQRVPEVQECIAELEEHDVFEVWFHQFDNMTLSTYTNLNSDMMDKKNIPFEGLDRKMQAINFMRMGMVDGAIASLDLRRPVGLESKFPVRSYDRDPVGFKRDMGYLIVHLRKFGL